MIKYITILFVGMLVINGQVMAAEDAESTDHDAHSGHDMDHGDHMMDDSDHSGHDMDHSDHSGHDMGHGDDHGMAHGDDHMMDDHSDHSMMHPGEDGHASHHGDGHHHMDDSHIMDHEGGMIMGQNFDKLPSSCDSISEEVEITVRAGREYANKFPGTMYAFDEQQWHVKPCAKVTWHFVNEDDIRHQFMMHGLPRYMYQNGMFHLEVTGPRTISGTLIVPATDETYLVHCDISQHMEKGMKAQLVVGNGGEDIPSIPGLTPYAFPDTYLHEDLPQVSNEDDDDSLLTQVDEFVTDNTPFSLIALFGVLIGLLSVPLILKLFSFRKNKVEAE